MRIQLSIVAALSLASILIVSGCPETQTPKGYCSPSECPPDGGPDASVKCGGQVCEGATPFCNETTQTCVACLDNSQCTDASKSKCDTTTNTCVECLATTDCPQAKPVCASDTKTCASCQNANDCSRFADAKVCGSTGACIQCNAADETACTQGVCDLTTNLCTTIAQNSASVCRACVNDKQCDHAGGYRCVPMNFQGNARAGGYCLLVSNGSNCTKPYTVPLTNRASLSQPTVQANYCGIAEDTTTCEAVLALIGDDSCTGDADCGAAGLNDGLCRNVNSVANRCTYGCSLAAQCPNGVACNTYCGGS